MKKLVLLSCIILLTISVLIGQEKLVINCDRYSSFLFNFETSCYDIKSDRNLNTVFTLKKDWMEISYITEEGSSDRITREGQVSEDNVKATTSFIGKNQNDETVMVIFDVKGRNIRLIYEKRNNLYMNLFPIKSVKPIQ